MSEARHPNTMWVIEWIERMSGRHGGIVYGTDSRTYDWGQALAREQYGQNWTVPGVMPDVPTGADVQRARRWELGGWPAWAWQPGEEAT